MQNYLNDIVMSWPNSIKSESNTDGSATALLAVDQYGDIGISSENCELTVFGLGGHIHHYSPTKDLNETIAFIPEIKAFVDDLIQCRIAGYSVYYDTYSNGLESACGGFGKWENEILYVNYSPKPNDRIIIRLHGKPELAISIAQIAHSKPG